MKIDLDDYIIDYELVKMVDIEILKRYRIFPIENFDIYILVGYVDYIEDEVEIFKLFQKPVKFCKIDEKRFEFELHHLYNKYNLYQIAKKSIVNYDENNIDKSQINIFCKELFSFAIILKSSDIHIEALKNSMIVRFRIDGVLIQFFRFFIELYPILSAVVKLFSKLDISLKRLPQNGRFSLNIQSKDYDFRVSILPTILGESIVLRILDNEKAFMGLQNIGFCQNIYKSIVKNINVSQGMILITGATGSGKTTTMYSILNQLNKKEKKIITIEDPIEYNIEGIMQVAINEDIGLTYEVVLKNILRQDPDVLMIGEIRDANSLKIAIQAALTGHLVISTLHTNNAIKTINRLLDLEAKPYLIASVLKLIVSQRLIRVLCNECKLEVVVDGLKTYKATGCSQCNLSGYTGRTIIAEYFEIDENISKMINDKFDISEILSYANYKNINDNAYVKVLDGTISLEEYYANEI